MTYLKSTTCELLQKLGVKCETGVVYCDGTIWYKTTLGWTTLGCESPSGSPDWTDEDLEDAIPAYSLPLLITDSEAMKLVFGERDIEEAIWCSRCQIGTSEYIPVWRVRASRMLDLCLSGDYEAAEQLLVEALTERTK